MNLVHNRPLPMGPTASSRAFCPKVKSYERRPNEARLKRVVSSLFLDWPGDEADPAQTGTLLNAYLVTPIRCLVTFTACLVTPRPSRLTNHPDQAYTAPPEPGLSTDH